jgi:3-methyladenine DNA glycosylase AlkD
LIFREWSFLVKVCGKAEVDNLYFLFDKAAVRSLLSKKAPMLTQLKEEMEKLADPEKAEILARFFKTGKGQYGEGDIFLGIVVPKQRAVAKKYAGLPMRDIGRLLASPIHEHRLVALLMLVNTYKKADLKNRRKILDFYIKHMKLINNWDLVDLSAPNILGDYLLDKERSLLYKLALSKNLWERRIAIISTMAFIKNNDFSDTMRIAELLLKDSHDLIHKSVGWMLREVGKRDPKAEEDFLERHCRHMPRTMLRYAVERFDDKKRKIFLNK